MQLDWYDRSVLRFVLEAGLLSATSRDCATPVQFGMSARRIIQRFEAVGDLYTSRQLPLEQSDLELVRRAASYRATAEYLHGDDN